VAPTGYCAIGAVERDRLMAFEKIAPIILCMALSTGRLGISIAP